MRGLIDMADPDTWMAFGNLHLVMIAVGLFFLISGAGLVMNIERLEAKYTNDQKTLWTEYYKSRFFKILVPFYITYIAYLVYKLCTTQVPLFTGIPVYRIIFTILGVDEYLKMTGVATFSLGIGEWFLGALMIMYAVFPLLYKALKKWPTISILAALLYYVLMVTFYNSQIAWHQNVLIKIFDFIAGMYLGINIKRLSRNWYPVVFILAAFFVKNPSYANTLVIIGLFSAGLLIETKLGTKQPEQNSQSKLWKVVTYISGITFYVYLVHHAVIYAFDEKLQGRIILSKKQTLLLFIIDCLVMYGIALIVKYLSERISNAAKRNN